MPAERYPSAYEEWLATREAQQQHERGPAPSTHGHTGQRYFLSEAELAKRGLQRTTVVEAGRSQFDAGAREDPFEGVRVSPEQERAMYVQAQREAEAATRLSGSGSTGDVRARRAALAEQYVAHRERDAAGRLYTRMERDFTVGRDVF